MPQMASLKDLIVSVEKVPHLALDSAESQAKRYTSSAAIRVTPLFYFAVSSSKQRLQNHHYHHYLQRQGSREQLNSYAQPQQQVFLLHRKLPPPVNYSYLKVRAISEMGTKTMVISC